MKIKEKSKEPFYFAGGKTGCLLVHGFTGSPSEMRLLGESLAAEGYTVLGILLAGHGKTPADLKKTYWHDWYQSVVEGYTRLSKECDDIYAIGLSMGGALCIYSASELQLKGLISICAPIYLADKKSVLAPLFKYVIDYYPKKFSEREQSLNEEMARFTYQKIPLKALDNLLKLIRAVRKRLDKVDTPALIIQSFSDKVVLPKSADYIYKNIGSREKELVYLDKSGHLATIDSDREKVFKLIKQFMQKHVEGTNE
ncbi:MAG: alpha/beta fold hydrolase [Bacillota bacterium]|nr:alpha/beta fold hydrolase [Bacillota bacterium]